MKSKILKTEGEYEAGLDRILALGDPEPGTPAGDELELLLLLVEYYESKHFEPIPYPHPISAIEFRMEQMGYTRADLGRLLESRSRATEILSGQRSLTMKHVRLLHMDWGIPAEVLIQEYELQKSLSTKQRNARSGQGVGLRKGRKVAKAVKGKRQAAK